MHREEARCLRQLPDAAQFVRYHREWLLARGAPRAEAEADAALPFDFADLAASRPDRLIEDGDEPFAPHVRLRAVWTPGHTPGHLCLHDEAAGLLLSGDHVLPRISPNIGQMDEPDVDPLSDYLESLTTVAKLAVDEVLPAHEFRFTGLDHRVAQLRRHHERRLAELQRLVVDDPDSSTWELAARLT
jgi:glyoxylase-like metal-dependent hydrolase (beta-lactamase superfamily II)